MVSLEKRGEYLKGILENEKFLIFYNFILSNGTSVAGESVALSDVIDESFVGILEAICSSDRQNFEKYYSQYSTRVPSLTSPFVNDDYLVFSLIIGVKKFNIPKEWIERVLQSRKCTSDDCNQSLVTFKNILLGNYNSLDNHFGTILVFQSILKEDLLLPSNKAKFYAGITSTIFPSKKSDFLNIIELNSYDLLINEQLFGGDSKYQVFKMKIGNFEKRCRQVSISIYAILYVIWIGSVYYLYYKFDFIEKFISSSESIFGFLGFGGLLALFFTKEKVLAYIEGIISNFFLGRSYLPPDVQ